MEVTYHPEADDEVLESARFYEARSKGLGWRFLRAVQHAEERLVRLQKHRCSAPFAQYIATWPCRRVWERAAIDCVTNACEQLHTEVFRATSLEQIATRAKSFFAMMPNLEQDSEDDRAEQEPETGERDG